jgi:group II intron reverse transcriptase/maturase
MPTWKDKLLQEVIRSILEAYYEPQFSSHSHGFRPGRGCHTALQEVHYCGTGTKWFIEGDISACFDRIDHDVAISILKEKIHDNRFIRLLENLMRAGYLEEWKYHTTFSGVPQGGVVSPILSNLVLDLLDKFVERHLIPRYTRGQRRQASRRHGALRVAACKARKNRDFERAKRLMREARRLPSRDPDDPNYRRLWYVRYADDFLLGFIGPKAEAVEIKQQIGAFLRNDLKLEMSDEKTLITHAREETARFLGYEIHVLHADDRCDRHGHRCINGRIGLRVPHRVVAENCSAYKQHGKAIHLSERVNDSVHDIVTRYQAEYRGLVQYYRMAYNLHTMSELRQTMGLSLVKTLARKLRTHCREVRRRFRATIETPDGTFVVLQVVTDRGPQRPPQKAYFGGVSLKRDPRAEIRDVKRIGGGQREILTRLLRRKCELCGRRGIDLQMHHIRKLADLDRFDEARKPLWAKVMAALRRKSLAVCNDCHARIHAELACEPE